MDIIQTVIMGLIQGLTEFIPVSSSGHLAVAQHFMSGEIDHKFLEYINIGTTLALIIYYRRQIVSIAREVIEQKKYSLARNILLTSIPAGLVGLAISGSIEHIEFFNNIYTVLGALMIVGVVMIILPRLPRARSVDSGAELSWIRALGIGCAQMLALIPGVSRSGSTIIAGRLSGMSSEAAANYSFLASLPIMLAVTAKLFMSSADRAEMAAHLPEMVIGNIVAFVAGYLAIGTLLRYLSKHELAAFGWYRIALAVVVVALIALLQ